MTRRSTNSAEGKPLTLGVPPSRRRVIASGAAWLAATLPTPLALAQAPNTPPTKLFEQALAALTNGRPVQAGRVSLDMPRLAESGNSVQLKVTVDSPMLAADHVKTIHVLSEQNPIAAIARFHLTPACGRAEVETYVRLATTQNVHAIAEMSDGSLWGTKAEAVVLLAACLDSG